MFRMAHDCENLEEELKGRRVSNINYMFKFLIHDAYMTAVQIFCYLKSLS